MKCGCLTSLFATGPVDAGVQGVPRHTQYLALHLVKTTLILENSGVGYLLVCTPNVQWLTTTGWANSHPVFQKLIG